MSSPPGWAVAPIDGAALLERAVGYTRTSLQLVARADLSSPTPCGSWDLAALLRHMDDSLAAFTEAAEIGYVDLVPVRSTDPTVRLVDRLKSRACALVGAWAQPPGTDRVVVAHHELGADLLAVAGSLEIAVHGWDVARACGVDRPLPGALAADLLELAPLVVVDADRPGRFAPPVEVPLDARPSTRLLAILGRTAD